MYRRQSRLTPATASGRHDPVLNNLGVLQVSPQYHEAAKHPCFQRKPRSWRGMIECVHRSVSTARLSDGQQQLKKMKNSCRVAHSIRSLLFSSKTLQWQRAATAGSTSRPRCRTRPSSCSSNPRRRTGGGLDRYQATARHTK